MIETKQCYLINRVDSSHYDGQEPGSKTLIEQFEEQYTIRELYSWSKLNIAKYYGRLGKKSDPDEEMRKIKTYTDYSQMLKGIIDSTPALADITAKTAYDQLKMKWRY